MMLKYLRPYEKFREGNAKAKNITSIFWIIKTTIFNDVILFIETRWNKSRIGNCLRSAYACY